MSSSNNPSDDAQQTAAIFHSAALRLLRRLRTVDEELGVSTARLSLLSVLVFVGPKTLTELAQIEQVSKPTITNLVKALVTEGYVKQKPNLKDGRSSTIWATAKGKTLLKKGQQRRVAELQQMLESLSPKDQDTIGKSAKIVLNMLNSVSK